jgi:NTP pyrophosphatase (non-canonical NTP hydrolase)
MKANTDNELGINQMLPLPWPSPRASGTPREPQRRVGTHQVSAEKGISPRLLTELQKEVIEIEIERGTISESIGQKSLLLTEEVFEVMKVLRVESGISTCYRPAVALGDELADVLFVCAAIANRVPTDLSLIWVDMRSARGAEAASQLSGGTSALAGALQLARRVLEVITTVPQDGDVDTNSDLVEPITKNLLGVLFSIDAIAASKKIDLTSALDGKMQKDQLRLWQ